MISNLWRTRTRSYLSSSRQSRHQTRSHSRPAPRRRQRRPHIRRIITRVHRKVPKTSTRPARPLNLRVGNQTRTTSGATKRRLPRHLTRPHQHQILQYKRPSIVTAIILSMRIPMTNLNRNSLKRPPLRQVLLIPRFINNISASTTGRASQRHRPGLTHPTRNTIGTRPARIYNNRRMYTRRRTRMLRQSMSMNTMTMMLIVLRPINRLIKQILPIKPRT